MSHPLIRCMSRRECLGLHSRRNTRPCRFGGTSRRATVPTQAIHPSWNLRLVFCIVDVFWVDEGPTACSLEARGPCPARFGRQRA